MKRLLLIISAATAIACSSSQQISKSAAKMIDNYGIDCLNDFKSRLDTLNLDIAEKGVLYHVRYNTTLLTGYSYHQVYDWDAYFESLYLSYYGISDYCFNNTKSFLKQQKANGFISRTINESRPRQHFKPFLAQMAELGSRQSGNYEWVNEKMERDSMTIFERLEFSIEHWFTDMDSDKNGLPVWNSADHSGMDNQVSRAGELDAYRYEGVDLACYIYREYKAMEQMASHIGLNEKSAEFATKAERLAAQVNNVFWDESEGIYYDRDEQTGQAIKIKCITTFIPLWAGIAPKERAERLVKEHLCNPDEFWLQYPVATYSKCAEDFIPGKIEGVCNWRGTAWIPTNYMLLHGLMDYGYDQVAQELAQKTFDLVYKENDITREFYDSTTGEGLGLPRFWGWSSLAYIMPLEMTLNYDPSKIGAEVSPIVTEHLKINFPESQKPLAETGL